MQDYVPRVLDQETQKLKWDKGVFIDFRTLSWDARSNTLARTPGDGVKFLLGCLLKVWKKVMVHNEAKIPLVIKKSTTCYKNMFFGHELTCIEEK